MAASDNLGPQWSPWNYEVAGFPNSDDIEQSMSSTSYSPETEQVLSVRRYLSPLDTSRGPRYTVEGKASDSSGHRTERISQFKTNKRAAMAARAMQNRLSRTGDPNKPNINRDYMSGRSSISKGFTSYGGE